MFRYFRKKKKIVSDIISEYFLSVAHETSPYVTLYNVNSSNDTFTKRNFNPSVTGTGSGCTFSKDGKYFASGHSSSPFIGVYKWNGSDYNQVWTPSVGGTTYGLSFSANGTYLAIASFVANGLKVFKKNGAEWGSNATSCTIDVQPPGNYAMRVLFSPDDNYLALIFITPSPFIHIYKRNGDVFNKLADPGILPTGACRGISWTPDSKYLAVGFGTAPYIHLYQRTGDSFAKLADLAVLPPTGMSNGIQFSSDGNYLAVPSDKLYVYKHNAGVLTQIAALTLPANNNNNQCSWSSDGKYLCSLGEAAPYIKIFKRSGDTFTPISNPSSLPGGRSFGCAFFPNPQYQGTQPQIQLIDGLSRTAKHSSISVSEVTHLGKRCDVITISPTGWASIRTDQKFSSGIVRWEVIADSAGNALSGIIRADSPDIAMTKSGILGYPANPSLSFLHSSHCYFLGSGGSNVYGDVGTVQDHQAAVPAGQVVGFLLNLDTRTLDTYVGGVFSARTLVNIPNGYEYHPALSIYNASVTLRINFGKDGWWAWQ